MARCDCPAAHVGAIACTKRHCLGPAHHAAEHVAALPKDELRAAIDRMGWDVHEDEEEDDGRPTLDELVGSVASWARQLRCAPGCECVCHEPTEASFDEAKRRRDERIAGPVVFLFGRLMRCLVRIEGGVEVHSLAALRDTLRHSLRNDAEAPAFALPSHVRAHGRLAAPPSGLQATPVACRVEDGQYVYDTLVVGAEWWAVLVDTSEGPTLFLPGGEDDEGDARQDHQEADEVDEGNAEGNAEGNEHHGAFDAFDTYLGYVVFEHEYGRRSYRCASPEQRTVTLRALDELRTEARRHDVHHLRQKSAKRRRLDEVPDVATMIRTPRSVVLGLRRRVASSATQFDSLFVRLVCDHHARDLRRRKRDVDVVMGRLYQRAVPIATELVEEGNPEGALAVYEAVAHEQQKQGRS